MWGDGLVVLPYATTTEKDAYPTTTSDLLYLLTRRKSPLFWYFLFLNSLNILNSVQSHRESLGAEIREMKKKGVLPYYLKAAFI